MFSKIIFLCSLWNVGNLAHTNQIFTSLSHEITSLQRYDINAESRPSDIRKQYLEITKKLRKEHCLIFAVGEKGIQALHWLNQNGFLNSSSIYVAVSLHQYKQSLANLPIDYVAVPEATINTPEKRKVIEKVPTRTLTFSIPISNPTLQELKNSYEQWPNPDKPSLDHPYIIVLLSGDAIDSKGEIKFFTQNSAETLFNYVYSLWQHHGKKHKIIVHNNSRTGKYYSKTGKIACLHEYQKGQNPAEAVDAISRYFVSLLEEKGLPYSFFNLAFEIDDTQPKPPLFYAHRSSPPRTQRKFFSLIYPLLYLAQNTDTFLVVPGDSVSMLGLAPLYIKADRLIVFKPSSMNDSHEAIINLAVQRGYLSYFSPMGEVISPKHPTRRTEEDTGDIVKDLLEGYRKKFPKEEHP